jgi:ribosome-associated translation inhibitor RaiA
VDVTIFTLRNGVVRVEDSEENLYASIDLVCDKVRGLWGEGGGGVETR